MDFHFNRWGEGLWVEGVPPGPHKINEGSIHFGRWGEAFWVEGVSPGPHKINEGCPHEHSF